MTVREILEGLDREIAASKAQTFRLEDYRQRIRSCVKGEPAAPAQEGGGSSEHEGEVLKLCRAEKKDEKPKRRAAA